VTLNGKAFPSYVAVAADGQISVGARARRERAIDPEGTISGCKRLMGERRRPQAQRLSKWFNTPWYSSLGRILS
jgi:molecular chaperone DnaK (HSP70)